MKCVQLLPDEVRGGQSPQPHSLTIDQQKGPEHSRETDRSNNNRAVCD